MDEFAPKVFVSYSHDSSEHKQWVGEISAKLRHDGIDVTLDQWDLSLGDDITKFMEDGLSLSDRVILICTENYVRKADAGVGGVAYERMIVTAELVQNLGTQKFIPVIRQGGDKPILPKFLGARFYVNFSEGQNFDVEYENLLRELHKQPAITKPPLGKSPFAQQPSGQEIPEAGKSEQIPLVAVSAKSKGITEIYEQALEIARQGDLVAWRKLIKDIRADLPSGILQKWRTDQQLDQKTLDQKSLSSIVESAVQLYAPLMVVALAGIVSGRDKFRDQRGVIDELANPGGWGRGGLNVVVEIPAALVFVFQSLCGAACLDTGQLDQALQLGMMKITSRNDSAASPLVRRTDLNGWPQSLGGVGGNCKLAWDFIFNAVGKWPWVSFIFGSEEEYKVALIAYYMSLHVLDLTLKIADGEGENLKETRLLIPACFLGTPEDISHKAYRLFLRSNPALIWNSLKVSVHDMDKYWPLWMERTRAWLEQVYPDWFSYGLVHQNLFSDL